MELQHLCKDDTNEFFSNSAQHFVTFFYQTVAVWPLKRLKSKYETCENAGSTVPRMPEACTVVSWPISSDLFPASLCAPAAGSIQSTCWSVKNRNIMLKFVIFLHSKMIKQLARLTQGQSLQYNTIQSNAQWFYICRCDAVKSNIKIFNYDWKLCGAMYKMEKL